ncbi:MAG: hypothetical protein L6Q75_04115 [Burkholderiaceae bacterium]|nr:hypothetical protein [Burkholderiaceae bacterium]
MVQALPLAPADQLARSLAKELPEPSRADFLRLTRALLHGPRFQWLLVEVPSDALRDRLLSALDRVMLAAHLQCSRLPLDRSLTDVPALEAALVRHAKGCAVVHVLGRRGWFDAARWDAFNVRRERLALEARARLVFWLDAEAIEAASMGAPDLWAWRSGVYSFSDAADGASPQVQGEAIAPVGAAGSSVDVRSVDERLKRIAALRAWLSEDPPPSDEEREGSVAELGQLLMSVGEYEAALNHWRDVVLPLTERLGHERNATVTRGWIADILQARGQLDEALLIRQEEQLPVYERLGDVREAAVAKGRIADILQARGQLDEALRIRQEEELPVFERLGDVRSAAVTKGKIADILQARGQLDEALRIWQEEQLPVFERLGDVRSAALAKGRIADILQARGQLDEALRIRQEEQLPVHERLGDVRSAAITKAQIGLQLLERGEPQGGERLLRQALSALQAMKLPEADQLAAQMHARGLATEDKAASS